MQIGQRVNTKFGTGTVVGYERITTIITHPAEYEENDRIEVKLDTPENWVIQHKGNPYFYIDDLTI